MSSSKSDGIVSGLFIIGVLLVIAGLAMVSEALAVIVSGLLFIGAAVLWEAAQQRSGAPQRTPE